MLHPLRILAVDDEPGIAQSMSYIFEGPAYEVASAPDGEAALDRLEHENTSYDVVIVDNNMPRLSGVELVEQLRERHFAGKILVLSAFLSAELRQAYDALKVDALMAKPFSIAGLQHTVEELAAA